MNTVDTKNLIIDTIADYGDQAFLILVAVIGLAVAYLVFKFGWNMTRSALDPRAEFGDLPRKGEKWGVPGRSM